MPKKRKLNSKNPKYHTVNNNAPKIKKKVLFCTAPHNVKVYGVWYEEDKK